MGNYFFVTYLDRDKSRSEGRMQNTVIEQHPFEWIKEQNFDGGRNVVIVFYRPISKGEYEQW